MIKNAHLPITFVLTSKSLGSKVSGGALASTARALRMMAEAAEGNLEWGGGTVPSSPVGLDITPYTITVSVPIILNRYVTA